MTDTTKSLLIVGAVGVGAYLVVKQVSSSAAAKRVVANTPAANAGLTGLINAGASALSGIFKSSSPQNTAVSTTGYASPNTNTGTGDYLASTVTDQQLETESDDQIFADQTGLTDTFDFLGGD